MVVPAAAAVGCTVNASRAARPGMMLKGALDAPASPGAAAVRVYPVPALSMLTSVNVAIPFTVVRVMVPAMVPPPGFVPMPIVTTTGAVPTVFPKASCTVTWTGGVIGLPAVAVPGETLKAS